jgi:hypothetical protein
MSVRETTDSPRGSDDQEREDSPAEMGEIVFEEAKALSAKQRGRLDKFRTTRPPRSPYKGSRSASTPPPCGPSSPHLSPPRINVDHPDSSLLPRPNGMRRGQKPDDAAGLTSTRIPDYSNYEEEVIITETKFGMLGGSDGPVETMKGRTYSDGNVEILKTDSMEEDMAVTVPLVTPEKVGP